MLPKSALCTGCFQWEWLIIYLIKPKYCDWLQMLYCNFPTQSPDKLSLIKFIVTTFKDSFAISLYFISLYFIFLYFISIYWFPYTSFPYTLFIHTLFNYTLFPYTLFPYTLFSCTLYPYTLLQMQIKKGMSYLVLFSLTLHFTCRSM